jgi:hypothetical protein
MSSCGASVHISLLRKRRDNCSRCTFNSGGRCEKASHQNLRSLWITGGCPENRWEHLVKDITPYMLLQQREHEWAEKKKKQKQNPPPLKKQIKNFIKSMAFWAKNLFPVASKKTYEKRLSICSGCEFYDPSGWKGRGKCLKCGCCTSAKAKLKTEKCPIGKW